MLTRVKTRNVDHGDRKLGFRTRAEKGGPEARAEHGVVNRATGGKGPQEAGREGTRKPDTETQGWPRKAGPEAEGKKRGRGGVLLPKLEAGGSASLEEGNPHLAGALLPIQQGESCDERGIHRHWEAMPLATLLHPQPRP